MVPASAAIKRVLEKPFGGEIPQVYQGYTSSFGASVMQMGVLPTLAVFANDSNSGSKENRAHLLTILHEILTSDDSGLSNGNKAKLKTKEYRSTKDGVEQESLFNYALDISKREEDMRDFRTHLLEAAIAAKLVIRTFKFSKP